MTPLTHTQRQAIVYRVNAEIDDGGAVYHTAIVRATEKAILGARDIDQERKEFEQWVSDQGLHTSHTVGWMWKTWQVARGIDI